MSPSSHYQQLVADCEERARRERSLELRREWEALARSYRRLAQQSQQNSRNDVVYQTPSPHASEPRRETQDSAGRHRPEAGRMS